jgi:hypothetical protein
MYNGTKKKNEQRRGREKQVCVYEKRGNKIDMN